MEQEGVMSKIIDYCIVESESSDEVEEQVMNLVSVGWTLLGTTGFAPGDEYEPGRWYQAMIEQE